MTNRSPAPAAREGETTGVDDGSPVNEAVEEAISREVEKLRKDDAFQSDGVYPPPLSLGPQAYRDCTLWSADWRKRLPRDHPFRPQDPNEFIGHHDQSYIDTLDLMIELGIPGLQTRPERSTTK